MSKVVDLLKQLQADSFVFYMKSHNLHWNIEGSSFYNTHKALEKIYLRFADIFDDSAERILQIGHKPYNMTKDCTANTKIKEESTSKFTCKEALKIVLQDYEYFNKLLSELADEAEKANDKVSSDYATSLLASFQKDIWMLKAETV